MVPIGADLKELDLVALLDLQAGVAQRVAWATYQGQLTDTNGELADGEYTMTFRLYDASEGGAVLWSETQTTVVVSGIFNVLLGEAVPHDLSNLPFDKPYWLGVQIGDAEQTPRLEFTATPYAFMAARATRAARLPEPDFDSDWFIMQSQVGEDSFEEIEHNLGDYPSLVKVLVRAIDGANEGFVFEGVGAAQSNDDEESRTYGGVVFAYDQTRVRVWAPDVNTGSGTGFEVGYIIHVWDGWGGELNRQISNVAEIRVLAWR